MRVDRLGPCTHHKLQSEGSPRRQPFRLGLSKAKSCMNIFDSKQFHAPREDETRTATKKKHQASVSLDKRPSEKAASRPKQATNTKPALTPRASMRNLFAPREDRTRSQRRETRVHPEPNSTRIRRQKSVRKPNPTQERQRRVSQKRYESDTHVSKPTKLATAKSLEIQSSEYKHALIPPPLRRFASAPQARGSEKHLQLNPSPKDSLKPTIRLDHYLAHTGTRRQKGNASIHGVSSASTKPEDQTRRRNEITAHAASTRRKAVQQKSTLRPQNMKNSQTPRRAAISAKLPASSLYKKPRTPPPSEYMSLTAIAQAYKQIMVEFGEDASEVTTGW